MSPSERETQPSSWIKPSSVNEQEQQERAVRTATSTWLVENAACAYYD